MMGFVTNEGNSPPTSPGKGRETVVPVEQLNRKSYVSYHSAMSSLSEMHHSLSSSMVTTPADSDPLLSPLQPFSLLYPDIRKSNVSDNSYIDPLSNEDGVFGSFVEHSSNENDIEIPRQRIVNLLPSSEYMNITVTNPQREHETSNSTLLSANSHVTYLITTKTNMTGFGNSMFSVRRRFKEVVTLSEQLLKSCRGFFIPPRPDKNFVEGQVMNKQEFVEQRRAALEKYLQRLAAHPIIKNCDDFRVFLKVQGTLPLSTGTVVAATELDSAVPIQFGEQVTGAASHEAFQPGKGINNLSRIFMELKQSVSNDWRGLTVPVEEDKEFLEKKEELHNFEQRLIHASQQAESFIKCQQDIGVTMGELGLAFIRLTKFENESTMFSSQRTRAAMMKCVATTAVKASRLYQGLNTRTVEHLDTLHEYLNLLLAIPHAYSDRSKAFFILQTLISELSALRTRADKLGSTSSKVNGDRDKKKSQKIKELEETIRVKEHAKQYALREYELIKENNRSELERFNREKKIDFLNMLKEFANSQKEWEIFGGRLQRKPVFIGKRIPKMLATGFF